MKKNIFDRMFIPRDVAISGYNITFWCNEKMFVEGFESIKEFSDTCLILKLKGGMIKITGRRLIVEYFSKGEIMVSGKIEHTDFEGE